MSYAIETRGLEYRAGSFALEDVSLRVPTGAIYGFLGPNGAGKTTTIQVALGLRRARQGTVTLLGEPVPSRVSAAMARVGYVPERSHLHRFLTVEQSLALHAAFHRHWDQPWAERLLDQFGVPRDRVLARLSKGEMGKLLMLQALCQRPDLLVLDEPTDGLDPVVRRDVLAAVVDYVSAHSATVLISSHLVHELERLCDWVGVMDRGRLMAELPMEEFKNGIKRIRLRGAIDRASDGPPFSILARSGHGEDAAVWIVDRWQAEMTAWIHERGVTVEAVDGLDLEEGFVERLRAGRAGGLANGGRS